MGKTKAPKYDSSGYDNAAQKYAELANKYTGNAGLQNASEQANLTARNASEQAGVSAQNQALNAGFSRAKSARMGQNASAQNFNNSYAQGYQNASQMGQNALNAQSNLMQGAMTLDQNKYNAKGNEYSAKMGMWSGALQGVAGLLSDMEAKAIMSIAEGAKGAEDKKDSNVATSLNPLEHAGKSIDGFGKGFETMSKSFQPISSNNNFQMLSDGRIKSIFRKDLSDEIINGFARLSSIDFKYKPEVQEKIKNSDDNKGVDDKEHIGIIAQELEQNPITEGAVKENDEGMKEIDIRHLTAVNTSGIAELSKKIIELENQIKSMRGE